MSEINTIAERLRERRASFAVKKPVFTPVSSFSMFDDDEVEDAIVEEIVDEDTAEEAVEEVVEDSAPPVEPDDFETTMNKLYGIVEPAVTSIVRNEPVKTEYEIVPDADVLIERARALSNSIGQSYIELGKICRTMIASGTPEQLGYQDDHAFFEKEIGLHYRKARYLISIANFIDEHRLSDEEVGSLGWSKAKELVGAPAAQLPELLKLAHTIPTDELKERVKQAKNINADSSPKPRKKLNMSFFDDQFIVIDSALDLACTQFETDNKALALFKLVSDWSLNQPVAPELGHLVAYLESEYGAKVILPDGTDDR